MKQWFYWPAHLTIAGIVAVIIAMSWTIAFYPRVAAAAGGGVFCGFIYIILYSMIYGMFKGEYND